MLVGQRVRGAAAGLSRIGRRGSRARVTGTAITTALLVCAAALPPSASASRALTRSERRDVLRSVDYRGPNQKRIRDPACISGRLSTANRRYASSTLTNTPSCVRRFGGATGEGALLRRKSTRSRRWRRVGSISDNCSRGEGGAPDRVLRDLGCGIIRGAASGTSAALGPADLRLTPDRLGPIRLGMTVEQASTALGATIEPIPSAYGCVYWGLPGTLQYSAQLLASKGVKLDLIMVTGRGIMTTRGIRVGDSLRRLRQKYGRRLAVAPKGYDLSAATKFYWIHSTMAGTKRVLRFGFYRGKVAGMTAGPQELVVRFGECA